MTRRCAVPGCDAVLYVRNTSGVCQSHNHASGWCRCFKCTGVVPDLPVSASPDVRVTTLPVNGNAQGGLPRVKVSLPKEPWA
jgi:hypothetical protein